MEPTVKTDQYELYLGDCLDVLPHLSGVDAVITDPPYGTTDCKWDSVIPFAPMWKQLERVTKPNAAIVLFGSQPFTSALVMSNPKMFKYELIWNKNVPTGMVLADKRPMKYHENICVFYDNLGCYNKQYIDREWKTQETSKAIKRRARPDKHGINQNLQEWKQFDGKKKNPSSVLDINVVPRASGTLHPTQKPVALMEYLIKTYTHKGERVLDFTMGSGSTGVACIKQNRKFIGIEREPKYFEIARKRLEEAAAQGQLFDEDASEETEQPVAFSLPFAGEGKEGAAGIFGQWPGDETDEQVIKTLEEIE